MPLLSDNELLLEHATWFAPHLPQPTIGAFASWLAPWLRSTSKRALEALYRVNHPAQERAEIELLNLLNAAPRRLEHRVSTDGQSGRFTDWPSTLTLSHPFAPSSFVHQSRAHELDNGLLAGLATIGRHWSYMLTEYGGYADGHSRVTSLRKATRPFGDGRLTPAHMRRLMRLPHASAQLQALRDALELMNRPLTDPPSMSALHRFAVQLSAMGPELDNQNDALEVSVILCIARAAQNLGWKVTTAYAGSVRPKPRLEMSSGTLRCAITKGRFEYPGQPERRAEDALARLERDALGLASTGRQPDVVISFWRVDAPDEVFFCIADAKRNQSGDGVAYFKHAIVAMTAYMVSFSGPLRARLSPSTGGFSAPLTPTATLFLQQSAGDRSDELQTRGKVVGIRERAWLAALDARHYAVKEQGSWQDGRVCAWFQRLSDSAIEAIATARPGRRAKREAANTQ